MQARSRRFYTLSAIVLVSGMTQGMLLPLLATLLELNGVAPSLNGLASSALYLGILVMAPLAERPLLRFGYKPVIVFGLAMVLACLVAFPLMNHYLSWLILRFLLGAGDSLLHVATQLWITDSAPEAKRGRYVSLYGLAFGGGFAIGPLLAGLHHQGLWLPFALAIALTLMALLAALPLRNARPSAAAASLHEPGHYGTVVRLAGIALLTCFSYGFLEGALTAGLPIYANRSAIGLDSVSQLLPAFFFSALLTQLPLGMLSDRFGRRPVMVAIFTLGTLAFTLASQYETTHGAMMAAYFAAGLACGSLYTLSVSYLADLLPAKELPAGNVLILIAFSVGSLLGPVGGGSFVDAFPGVSFHWLLAANLALPLLGLALWRRRAG